MATRRFVIESGPKLPMLDQLPAGEAFYREGNPRVVYLKLNVDEGVHHNARTNLTTVTGASRVAPCVLLGDADEWETQDSYQRPGTLVFLHPGERVCHLKLEHPAVYSAAPELVT